MLKVYGMSASGNCYKIKLLLEQLNKPYQWQEIDMLKGETRTAEFLAMNPNGKVPVLQTEDGEFLAESNAIIFYLAEETPLLPNEKLAKAQALQWMFFEQYSHEPYLAVARFICKFLPADHPRHAELPRLLERGHQALAVMENHLGKNHFFVGDTYSIADIALYAYTHVAADGGFNMEIYPAINKWLQRIEYQPRFVSMT